MRLQVIILSLPYIRHLPQQIVCSKLPDFPPPLLNVIHNTRLRPCYSFPITPASISDRDSCYILAYRLPYQTTSFDDFFLGSFAVCEAPSPRKVDFSHYVHSILTPRNHSKRTVRMTGIEMAQKIQKDVVMRWLLVVNEKKGVSRMDCGVLVWL